MRYLVAILIAGILLLGFRVLFRRGVARAPGASGAPASRWPWVVLAAALLAIAALVVLLRGWALAP